MYTGSHSGPGNDIREITRMALGLPVPVTKSLKRLTFYSLLTGCKIRELKTALAITGEGAQPLRDHKLTEACHTNVRPPAPEALSPKFSDTRCMDVRTVLSESERLKSLIIKIKRGIGNIPGNAYRKSKQLAD